MQPALFAKLAALHEGLQTAREVLQHVVHFAAFVHQRRRKSDEKATFSHGELTGKWPRHDRLECLEERSGLQRIGQQAPEGRKGLTGVALADE
jgi:hypothetical protein